MKRKQAVIEIIKFLAFIGLIIASVFFISFYLPIE